jgi:hypothetical protein
MDRIRIRPKYKLLPWQSLNSLSKGTCTVCFLLLGSYQKADLKRLPLTGNAHSKENLTFSDSKVFYYLLNTGNWIWIDGKIAESDPNPDPTIEDLDLPDPPRSACQHAFLFVNNMLACLGERTERTMLRRCGFRSTRTVASAAYTSLTGSTARRNSPQSSSSIFRFNRRPDPAPQGGCSSYRRLRSMPQRGSM